MGAPRKEERRDRELCIRVTEREREMIRARAAQAGVSVPSFVVGSCRGSHVAFVVDRLPGEEPAPPRPKRSRRGGEGVKSEHIDVRVTPSEKARIADLARACGMTVGDLLVALATRPGAVSPVTVPDETLGDLSSALRELQAAGRNLNQLTRSCNLIADTRWDTARHDDLAKLAREAAIDNERTRAALNDALDEIYRVLGDMRESISR